MPASDELETLSSGDRLKALEDELLRLSHEHEELKASLQRKMDKSTFHPWKARLNDVSNKADGLKMWVQNADRIFSSFHLALSSKAFPSAFNAPVSAGPVPTDRQASQKTRGFSCNVVYFLRCPEIGVVKIGTTSNLTARLASLRTGCPSTCEVIMTMPGYYAEEALCHDAFKKAGSYTGLGEWFFESGNLDFFVRYLRSSSGFSEESLGYGVPIHVPFIAPSHETFGASEWSASTDSASPKILSAASMKVLAEIDNLVQAELSSPPAMMALEGKPLPTIAAKNNRRGETFALKRIKAN